MIVFCEFRVMHRYVLSYLMAVTVIGLSTMLIFCRGHYFIDLFGGVIFGHYLWMFAERRAWLIDYLVMKIPFPKRFPFFDSKCGMCKEPINQWALYIKEHDGLA